MNYLVNINRENQTVSARELYDFLGFDKRNWVRWCDKNIVKNKFSIENEDYKKLLFKTRKKDFCLTLDFAKRLSMLARTERGEIARKYFIECERIAKGRQTLELNVLRDKLSIYERMEQIRQVRKDLAKEMRELTKSMFTIKAKHQLITDNRQLQLL